MDSTPDPRLISGWNLANDRPPANPRMRMTAVTARPGRRKLPRIPGDAWGRGRAGMIPITPAPKT